MATKLTAESFVEVVRKSGLVENTQLDRLLVALQNDGVSISTPEAIAQGLITRGAVTQWQANKLLAGKYKGFDLDKYRLMSLLGRGGMSSVYLAEHLVMQRRVAIKILPAKMVDDSSYLGRFHREAQAVAALDHKNIVRAFDVAHVKDGGTSIHFLVMEYVDGPSLQDRVIKDGVLDITTAADYIRAAADGLAHAHQAGMVHRDVKPGNLLVDGGGVVKILDLGLARFFDDDDSSSLTVAHNEKVLGTADYLSPEQALDSHTVDARSDIYSLGCTLYFLLSGQPPFNKGTLTQKLMNHQTKEPEPIETFRADVPKSLAVILRRMMAKKVEARYKTVAEVSRQLSLWLLQNSNLQGSPVKLTSSRANVATQYGRAAKTDVIPARKSGSVNANSSLVAKGSSVSKDSAVRRKQKSNVMTSGNTSQLPVAEALPVDEDASVSHTGSSGVLGSTSLSSTHIGSRSSSVLVRGHSSKSSLIQRKSSRMATIIVGGVTIIILATIGNWINNSRKRNTEEAPPIVDALRQKVLPSELKVGPNEKYKSIGDALKAARDRFKPASRFDRQVISVAGGHTYRERIVLDRDEHTWPSGIHIVSRGRERAILAPRGIPPIVRLAAVRRFEIEGFELRAEDKKVAVVLDGALNGLALRNLVISGFSETGILGTNVTGAARDVADAVSFESLVFRAGSSQTTGVRLRTEQSRLSHIDLNGCRFNGPMSVGVAIKGDSDALTIRDSIFDGLEFPIRFDSQEMFQLLNFELAHNTFRNFSCGIDFVRLPYVRAGRSVDISAAPSQGKDAQEDEAPRANMRIESNLFVDGTGPEARTAIGTLEDLSKLMAEGGCQGNWTSRSASDVSNPRDLELFSLGTNHFATQFEFLSSDPNGRDYLLPTENAPYSQAGATQGRGGP